MAREFDFKEYSKKYEDADGDEHVQVIRAAVITDEDVKDSDGKSQPRQVVTPTGARNVHPGDVIVETETPGVYDYLSADGWESSDYAEGTDGGNSAPKDSDSDGASDDSDDKDKDKPVKKAVASRRS